MSRNDDSTTGFGLTGDTKTVVTLTTHFALLGALLLMGFVASIPFDLRIIGILVGIESAVLGKNIAGQIHGQVITIQLGSSDSSTDSSTDGSAKGGKRGE